MFDLNSTSAGTLREDEAVVAGENQISEKVKK